MPTVDLPLRDVHLPEAISWWPPAIGWWMLAVLLPLLFVGVRWLYKILTRKTAIKSAKRNLASIKEDKESDDLRKLSEISMLIRRVAISIAPRSEAAGLTGQSWLAYLDRSVKGEPFSQGVGRFLCDAQYRKEAPPGLDINKLIGLCDEWLKAQREK